MRVEHVGIVHDDLVMLVRDHRGVLAIVFTLHVVQVVNHLWKPFVGQCLDALEGSLQK